MAKHTLNELGNMSREELITIILCCTKQTKKHSICNANLLCMWCGYIVPAVP